MRMRRRKFRTESYARAEKMKEWKAFTCGTNLLKQCNDFFYKMLYVHEKIN